MNEMERERDLVLNPNEFAYVLDKTKGIISCVVGSYKMSLSNSDALVVFNSKTKRFEEANARNAITTFVSAPENWYIQLKNPAKDNLHPVSGKANTLPDLQIGKKINIKGNVSFPLFPGQMAKAIQGHRLHSNQYLLARVYDADVLNNDLNADDNTDTKYVVGQLLVIKGTEVPFYIPPTGIEVLPVDGTEDVYVRNAVTLERLEYCILKNEGGEKKYVHGADVVFPEPDEIFITNKETGDYKFKAIELSEISGVYIKVIADYEENGTNYKTGDELFITGKEQMIYYPRPEHAIISYEGKIIHHAIAIPSGEGRYVLNRKTGEIKMIKGAKMYLPDPRNEVVVQRKLTQSECETWYPGNKEVLKYNTGIDLDVAKYTSLDSMVNTVDCGLSRGIYVTSSTANLPVTTKMGGDISRGNTYSKPRTITFDNKFDGVVSINVWTGYAINVVAKNGKRKIVTGPETCLLEYDETLEVLELSTGRPKTTDNLIKTVYLRTKNNKISDLINAKTKDFVDVNIKVSYCVDFLDEYKDNWFNVENYIKYLCDKIRSLIKAKVRQYSIEEFYDKAEQIVNDVVFNNDTKGKKSEGYLFKENGMLLKDVEVLSVKVLDYDISQMITEHQHSIVSKVLSLSEITKENEIEKQISLLKKESADRDYEVNTHQIELNSKVEKARLQAADEERKIKETSRFEEKKAEQSLIPILKAITEAEVARDKIETDNTLAYMKSNDALAKARLDAQSDAIQKTITAISPELVSALVNSSNADLLKHVTDNMSPYAIATDTSVVDVTDKLLRGTSLEGVVGKVLEQIKMNSSEGK